MFLFHCKKSLIDSGIFNGFIDWHCHILPGVDDGVQEMKESLKILARYEELGIREIWLTPHVMEDIPNETKELKERYKELCNAYRGTIQLHLAAEYMMDNLFEERLRNNDLLPIGENGRTLLVETSYFNPPMDLNIILTHIRDKGYQPLLAHPERYFYMDQQEYQRLKSMNVLFQSNITSLSGAYGKDASEKVTGFLSKGWVNHLGTDLHQFSSFERAIRNKSITGKVFNLLKIGL